MNYDTSADYVYIEAALRALWQPFNDLVHEIETFNPRSPEDFDNDRRKWVEHLKELNPTAPSASIEDFVDKQIASFASSDFQLVFRFHEPFMTYYVKVALLSHSLCEATINAILAIGLASIKSESLFSMIEKAEIKEKWRSGPKSFYPAYELPSDTALYETLAYLTKARNKFVHYKIQLNVEGKEVFKGSPIESKSIQENIQWVRRFFSLPYDLHSHARNQIQNIPMMILGDRTPIQIADVHKW